MGIATLRGCSWDVRPGEALASPRSEEDARCSIVLACDGFLTLYDTTAEESDMQARITAKGLCVALHRLAAGKDIMQRHAQAERLAKAKTRMPQGVMTNSYITSSSNTLNQTTLS